MNIPTKNEIIKINKNTWKNDFIIYDFIKMFEPDPVIHTKEKPRVQLPVTTKKVTSMIITEINREPYMEFFRSVKRIPGRSGVVLTNSATGVRRITVKGVFISETREENINKIDSFVKNLTDGFDISNGLKVICFPDVSINKGQFAYLESVESDVNEGNGRVVEISLKFAMPDYRPEGVTDWFNTTYYSNITEI